MAHAIPSSAIYRPDRYDGPFFDVVTVGITPSIGAMRAVLGASFVGYYILRPVLDGVVVRHILVWWVVSSQMFFAVRSRRKALERTAYLAKATTNKGGFLMKMSKRYTASFRPQFSSASFSNGCHNAS